MPLEEGLLELLVGCFSFVMGMAILTIVFIWFRNKRYTAAYVWTVLHLLLFSTSIFFILNAVSFNYQHPMASEENSFNIGVSGVIWFSSLICLIIGIFKFSKSKEQV